MRTGEGAGLPGYDGNVEATRCTPLVPHGLSVWEMGVGKDRAEKASSDHRNRTEDSLGIDKASATFVLVTRRRWPTKTEWAPRKHAEGHWRDVRALDADDIERALDEAPAAHFWLSEVLGMPPAEGQTLEDWSERFSAVYEPALTSRMVLAGRANEAAGLAAALCVLGSYATLII
jgi:hypothetical protein